MKIYLFIFLIIFSKLISLSVAQVPNDTIYFAGYQAINYQYVKQDGGIDDEWQIYLCDKKILTSPRWPGIHFYNFCAETTINNEPCYFNDMNADGKPEVIFVAPSGKNDMRESYYIYSLDTIATELNEIDGINKGLGNLRFGQISFLGKEQIPQLFFDDLYYQCWHYPCSKSPAPLLVWKWEKTRYRLYNFIWPGLIMGNAYDLWPDSMGMIGRNWLTDSISIKNYLKELASLSYSPTETQCWIPGNDSTFPVGLFGIMLKLYTCAQTWKVDRLFISICPDSINANHQLLLEIRNKVNSDPWIIEAKKEAELYEQEMEQMREKIYHGQ